MPGIFIGIGGIGGSIVSQVRQALNLHVAFAGNTPAAQAAAGQFRFLLIDTWRDSAAKGFDQAQVFDFPVGKDKFGVDERIDTWYHGGDQSFRYWWPERRNAPLKLGDFASGAGQLRIKGKLAYRVALTGSSPQVAKAVEHALYAIDAVRGPATGIRPIPVYLVCSLGGGTGSGMVLTFAQHLRQHLPDHCSLIGVFPLAGITELGPGGADRQSIWANTDAALREIDYCQRVSGTPENRLTPFFQWPGDGNVLYGQKRPFEYVYLFGRTNQSGLALETFSEYIDLISETLIAESFSTLIDEGLATGISGPHSQFIMNMLAKPEIGGQPTTYASASIGSLVYPAERIERHLGRRYAMAVVDRMLEIDQATVATMVDDFTKTEKLGWDDSPSLKQRLYDQVENKATSRLSSLPSFSKSLKLDKDEPFARANQTQAVELANLAKTTLDSWVLEHYQQHLQTRRKVVAGEYAAPDQGIRRLVRSILEDEGANALGTAHAVVAGIKRLLDQRYNQLNERIEGNEEAAVPIVGLKKALLEQEDGWSSAVQRLNKGFGSGLSRAFNRGGQKAKETFIRTAWRRYYQASTELQDLVAGRALYRDLAAETERVEQALGDLIAQLGNVRTQLERLTGIDVGKHGKAGVLDLAVLDDPKLIAYHFDSVLNEVIAQDANNCAIALTTPVVTGTGQDGSPAGDDDEIKAETLTAIGPVPSGVVQRFLDRKLATTGGAATLHGDFRDQIMAGAVDDGIRLLRQPVRSLSIWEALAAECTARLEFPGLADSALLHAVSVVDSERAIAEQAGAPQKDRTQAILRHFIYNKLFECQKMVRPYWNLDSQMTADYGQPYHFTVIATDRDAYQEADTKFGISGVLEDTARSMQAGTPKWLPGRDRIVLYTREGVAPLFYLNDQELKSLRDAAAQKGREKFLYTDRRFERLLDPVIRPREDPDETLRFAIALSIQLGVVSRVSGNGAGPHPSALRLFDGSEHASVVALDDALQADPALAEAFLQRVDAEMQRIKVAERNGELYETLHRAQSMQQDAAAGDRPAESRWWKQAERAIMARMNYGQFFVSV